MSYLLFLSSSLYAEPLSLQTDQALAVHLSTHGLDRIEDAVIRHIPTQVTISGGGSSLECSSDSALDYIVSDIVVDINVNEIAVTPSQDNLRLDIYGSFQSNSVDIALLGDCSVITDIDETCTFALPTTAFQLGISVDVNFSNGTLNVTSAPVESSISPIGNPLSNCLLADAADTILAQQPSLINDLILSELQGELDGIPEDIEDGLASITDDLTVTESTELLGTSFDIEIFPTAVQIDEYGVWIGLGGAVHTEIPDSSCIDPLSFEPLEDQSWPEFTGMSLGTGLRYDAGVFVGRSFVDNVLYGVWASGVLCIDAAELAGLSLNGELAGNFFGSEVTDLLGTEAVDLILGLEQPPTILFSDDQPPLAVGIDDLSLELMGPVDDRKVRVLEVDIAADIGAYITLNQNKLLFDVPINTEDFTMSESYSDFIGPGYSLNVDSLLDLAMGAFDFETPSYILPTPLHLEWGALTWEPNAEDTWQGGYVFLETDHIQPIAIPGCSVSDFGCSGGPSIDIDVEQEFGCDQDIGGCEGSCSTAGTVSVPVGRLLGVFFLVLGALFRRRP